MCLSLVCLRVVCRAELLLPLLIRRSRRSLSLSSSSSSSPHEQSFFQSLTDVVAVLVRRRRSSSPQQKEWAESLASHLRHGLQLEVTSRGGSTSRRTKDSFASDVSPVFFLSFRSSLFVCICGSFLSPIFSSLFSYGVVCKTRVVLLLSVSVSTCISGNRLLPVMRSSIISGT